MLSTNKEIPIVIFDGNCGLCNSIVKLLIKKDKFQRLKFVSNQSEDSKFILSKFNDSLIQIDSIILIEGVKINFKSKAAILITKYLPFPWNLLQVFHFVPSIIVDNIYDFVAERRSNWLGNSICDISTDSERID